MDRLLSVYKETITLFRSTMTYYMPSGPYQDFQHWAISTDNDQYRKWHQIIGIPQFAKLTDTLLADIVPEEDKWIDLLPYISRMNAYLIYETISDNLAIGLAQRQDHDTTYDQRKHILLNFNDAMIARLEGNDNLCQDLLDEIRVEAQNISVFKQSLTEQEQTEMAIHYLSSNNLISLRDIEYDTWSPLVGNIESCAFVSDMLKSHLMGSYLKDGLILRYAAVNELLKQESFSIQDLTTLSTHSILVIPVLAYYISVLAEVIYPNSSLEVVMENQILQDALEDAALMVRLTNDLGTNLVVSQEYIPALLNELYNKTQMEAQKMSLNEFLLGIASSDINLTRIQKDIEYGEYNVSLHALTDVPLSAQNLLVFGTNLAYFNQRYQQCRVRLEKNLSALTKTLKNDKISQLIKRFVDFHEHIYSFQFNGQSGDYATKPDMQQRDVKA